ncbi:MAG: glycoside hydrolase family 88 protein, partial [Bacteroidota bacterium]
YHADDILISQMYLDMFQLQQNRDLQDRILAPTKSRIDYILDNPSQATLLLDYSNPQTTERWSWCDALFMAPPVYSRLSNITNDPEYLQFMDIEFRASYELLYDEDEDLFFRDHNFFPEKRLEANGKKIFWGRGNGWVMGGLVLLLQDLPTTHPIRPFYEQLFQKMAKKVVSLQNEEGFWHASLLDPVSYPNPESSSSAFFCYAIAYGLNSGLLDGSEYQTSVIRSWEALISAVFPNGKLGWVQPIGGDPQNATVDQTEVYGVGALLLAGTEMLKLAE